MDIPYSIRVDWCDGWKEYRVRDVCGSRHTTDVIEAVEMAHALDRNEYGSQAHVKIPKRIMAQYDAAKRLTAALTPEGL